MMVTRGQRLRAKGVGPSVALLVETSTSWGAGIVSGICRYAKDHGPWFFHIEPHGRYERLTIPSGWRGDGIVARVTSIELAREIVDSGLPTVNVSWFDIDHELVPRCSVNEFAGGRMAAHHFFDRGFHNYAYCGPLHRPRYTDHIRRGFIDTLTARELRCVEYTPKPDQGTGWHVQLEHLGNWLKSLPKPTALLAWNDVRGRHVTEACVYAGISVPDEVAVLGGEYDELAGTMSTPPLSTIDWPTETVGYEAARLLARMMSGENPPAKPALHMPRGIIARQSTDVLAIESKILCQAMRYIHQHACEGIRVSDVLANVPISRRVLEQQCKKMFGRSPAAEIRRIRLERARKLLIQTDWAIPKVAVECGFAYPENLARVFRREMGMAPSEYRRRHVTASNSA